MRNWIYPIILWGRFLLESLFTDTESEAQISEVASAGTASKWQGPAKWDRKVFDSWCVTVCLGAVACDKFAEKGRVPGMKELPVGSSPPLKWNRPHTTAPSLTVSSRRRFCSSSQIFNILCHVCTPVEKPQQFLVLKTRQEFSLYGPAPWMQMRREYFGILWTVLLENRHWMFLYKFIIVLLIS